MLNSLNPVKCLVRFHVRDKCHQRNRLNLFTFETMSHVPIATVVHPPDVIFVVGFRS